MRFPTMKSLGIKAPRLAAAAIPGLRTLGPRSVSTLLKIALDVAYVLLAIITGLLLIAFLISAFIPLQDVNVTVSDDSGGKAMPLMQQVQLTIGLGVLTGAILALTVHPNWVFLCAFFGAGLTMAGSTGWCGLAILMSKMPWNRVAGQSSCASGNCSTTHS